MEALFSSVAKRKILFQAAPYGALPLAQTRRYVFLPYNKYALTSMDGGNADFAGAKSCQKHS
jgi:hypothetical protein